MNRPILLMALLLATAGCERQSGTIERIIMDFPHGESRLMVERNGTTYLYYGSRPQFEVVSPGTFPIDTLFDSLKTRIHENRPREDWPDPQSTAGMVTVVYESGEERDYLIFDEFEFARQLFGRARLNIVGAVPPDSLRNPPAH